MKDLIVGEHRRLGGKVTTAINAANSRREHRSLLKDAGLSLAKISNRASACARRCSAAIVAPCDPAQPVAADPDPAVV